FQSDASEVFKKVQLSKIDRMWEYAQATSCRTNVILNYFGENRSEPCGHCDNCLNPPVGFDGTILAQKALSAVKRTNESVPVGLVVDILRGSYRREVTAAGYEQIKTFGAGRHTSKSHWLEYITQLINLGLLEIDYTDHSRLKLTALSKPVLFNGEKVTLTQPREWVDSSTKFVKKKSKRETFEDRLIEELTKLRKQIAQEDGIAPFNVFADSTLKEMARNKVCFRPEFFKLSGMSAYKFERYADRFLEKIREVMLQSDMKNLKGRTHLETLKLFNEGKSVSEIARHRDIGKSTIIGHLAILMDKEEEIDVQRILSMEDLEKITEAWSDLGQPTDFNQVFSRLDGLYDYAQIKIAVAWSKQR
ncbi:MAG: helix-turn-helix domain-containing protein, partial [Bacteroidia bacterium]|nr:helix-turn-helix domain-containing protein [Bacteroidia bacterium]